VRVLVVAAYLSADGSYGGPVSVALDHASALAEAGCTVTVAAGWDGAARLTHSATLRLFRAHKPLRTGFAGLVAPGLLPWVARHAREFDVVHVHVTRDLVTLPAAWLAQQRGVPVVLQTHGQIRPEASRGQAALDAVLTRRVFRRAAAFLALTAHEEEDLRALGVADARLHRIDNGVPAAARYAAAPAEAPLVLYSSRLAERKRPQAFVAAAELVARARPDARFELWGPDGGVLADTLTEIERRGLTGSCVYRGATTVEQARAHLADAAVFVLPSFAEPFPMALLEALGAGLPVVVTDQTGLSSAVAAAGAGRVTDGSPEQLGAAVLELLEPGAWAAAAAAAQQLAQSRFAMPRIAARLLEVYPASPR
jgi:glycosyltransferase involved in cell wall biosynthesis